MLSCVGHAAVAVPTAVLAVGGYFAYVYAASIGHTWSPQFALLWALINSVLLAVVIVIFLLLQEGDEEQELVASGSMGSSQQNNHTSVAAVSTFDWRGGHCFQGRAEILHFGVGGGVASLCLALLALLVDPQVGLSCCRRKSTCLVSERYSSLFDRTAAEKVDVSASEFDFDVVQDE
jgi:hypothetical protein